jgi:hypothetical protein
MGDLKTAEIKQLGCAAQLHQRYRERGAPDHDGYGLAIGAIFQYEATLLTQFANRIRHAYRDA